MSSTTASNCQLTKRYERWMVALHYTESTKKYAQVVLGRFNKFLGKRPIPSVTHVEIREFLTHISAYGATLETTYRHLGVLRRFYDFLNLGGVVSYVAPRLVRIKHIRRSALPILSEVEIRRLLRATRTKRERALIAFIYGTGCRLRESTHLRVEDINFENRIARVHGKFAKDRIVFLPRNTVHALQAYLAGRLSGYVFRDDRMGRKPSLLVDGGHWEARWVDYGRRAPCGGFCSRRKNLGSIDVISPQTARARFKKLVAGVKLGRPVRDRALHNATVLYVLNDIGHRAGLKNVGVHVLRRSFATHLYDHGAPVEIIQALLGHVYLGTTLGYTRLSRSRIAKTVDESHPFALAYEQ